MGFSHLEWDVKFSCIEKRVRNYKFGLWIEIYSYFFSGAQTCMVQG